MELSGKESKENVEAAIARALQDMRYGSIEITIHDARVVQIERRERVRIEPKEDHPPRKTR